MAVSGPPTRAETTTLTIERKDTAAWERLVADEHGRVYAMLRRLTGDRDIAADLTQDAFVRAYASAEGFEGRSQPSTWLCGIALNCYRGWRRLAGRTEAPDDLPDDLPDPTPGAEELAAMRERDGLLRAAVDSLPEPYRHTVALHYFAEIPSVEIAADEGVDPGTVRWRLHKALRQLWVILEPALRKEGP